MKRLSSKNETKRNLEIKRNLKIIMILMIISVLSPMVVRVAIADNSNISVDNSNSNIWVIVKTKFLCPATNCPGYAPQPGSVEQVNITTNEQQGNLKYMEEYSDIDSYNNYRVINSVTGYDGPIISPVTSFQFVRPPRTSQVRYVLETGIVLINDQRVCTFNITSIGGRCGAIPTNSTVKRITRITSKPPIEKKVAPFGTPQETPSSTQVQKSPGFESVFAIVGLLSIYMLRKNRFKK